MPWINEETRSYRLFCDGQQVSDQSIRPGEEFFVGKIGQYTAVAVEWSGLESELSLPVVIKPPAAPPTLEALEEKPADFSWTTEQWKDDAKTIRETIHLQDGVIRREWFEDGVLARRHDLNADGKPTRRVTYQDGRMATREYHSPDDRLVSREIFAPDGFITEQTRFVPDSKDDAKAVPRDTWFFERGTPVRHLYHATGREYFKKGDRWGYEKDGRFIDTPREG